LAGKWVLAMIDRNLCEETRTEANGLVHRSPAMQGIQSGGTASQPLSFCFFLYLPPFFSAGESLSPCGPFSQRSGSLFDLPAFALWDNFGLRWGRYRFGQIIPLPTL